MMPEVVIWGLNLLLLGLALGGLWYAIGRPHLALSGFGAALLLRLVGGVALGWFYLGKYPDSAEPGGDTFTLSRYAAALTTWGHHDFRGYLTHLFTATDVPGAPLRLYASYSNSFFFARSLSLLNWLTGANYWLNGLWLSAAAFAGSWLLARELLRLVPRARWGVWAGLLWPSLVFWAAGVSKDAVLLASLGAFAAAALRLVYPPEPGRPATVVVGGLLLSGWVLWQIKFFIAVVVFVSFGALALAGPLQRRWPRVRTWQVFLGLALALAPLSRVLHRAFRPDYLREHLLRNQTQLLARSSGRPQLVLPLEPSLWSFARYAPAAALGVFTRPWPWEGSGLLWRVSGLENGVLLGLAVWGFVGWWRRGRPWGLPLLAAALGLVVGVVAVMFGLSTPNLGTLHRYRVVLLPFTLFLLDWWRVGGQGAAVTWPPSGSLGRSSRS